MSMITDARLCHEIAGTVFAIVERKFAAVDGCRGAITKARSERSSPRASDVGSDA
jgi:hypothetical protein